MRLAVLLCDLGLSETPKPEHLAKRGGVWFEDIG